MSPLDELLAQPIPMGRTEAPVTSDLANERIDALLNYQRPNTFRLPYMTYDEVAPKEDIYSITDFKTIGQKIRDNVALAIEKRFPVVGDKYTLTVENVRYEKPKLTSTAEERDVVLHEGSLNDRLKGDWVLYDNETGKEIQRKGATLLNVPRMTERGTFIRNGSEIGLKNMFRLRPGIYTRIKNNGIVAAQINPAQTTGRQMTMELEPETGVLSVKRGTRTYGLLPILKAAGVSDDVIKAAWGEDLFNTNQNKYGKLSTPNSKSAAEYSQLWEDGFKPILLDKETTEYTLGKPFAKMEPEALLRASQNMFKVQHSMSMLDTDDRDSLQYQRIMGPADYIPERIVRDGGGLLRNLFNQVTRSGNLDPIMTGAFQPQVDSVFLDDKHAGYIDGSSPEEALDYACAISRLGEGGIGSVDAAPAETRGVNDSYAGFIDPVRSVESLKVGLDVYTAYGVKKDSAGNLYNTFKDKTGKARLVDMRTTAKSIVATPEFFDPKADPNEFIPAFYHGKGIEYVRRNDVDYYIDSSNRMMSIGAGTIPLIGGIRSNRTLMGCLHPDTELRILRYSGDNKFEECVTTAGEYLTEFKDSDRMVVCNDQYKVTTTNVRGVHKVVDKHKCYKVTTGILNLSAVVTDTHKWFVKLGYDDGFTLVTTEELKAAADSWGKPFVKLPAIVDINGNNTKVLDCVGSVEEVDSPEFTVDIDVDDNAYMLDNGLFTHNSKYGNQALSLQSRQAPLVQRKLQLDDGTNTTTEKYIGRQMGAKFAPVSGTITSVTGDEIRMRGADGKMYSVDLYNNLPANQKGFLHNTPVVKPGDHVKKDQVLAPSNYTDDNGTAALGTNLRVAFLTAPNGGTFEDGITISESAAKKLSSEQMYKVRGDTTDDIEYNKVRYLSLFKNQFTPEQLDKLGDDGLPKPGVVFNEGDPVYLGVQERPVGVHGVSRNAAAPYVHYWGHSEPGTVTDVVRGKKHLTVYTKAYTPMQVGDKMCFDEKTEVMTDKGWKLFKDLDDTERVLTLAYETGETYFTVYASRYQYEHEGIMYKLVTSKLDMLITEEHNCLVSCSPAANYITLRKAKQLYGHDYIYHITGNDISNKRSYADAHEEGYKEEWVKYKGTVYCIEVPVTHTMFVRRNGKCYWSGNSNRFGAKGTVAQIIPDDQMPQDSEDRPFDVLQSPLGLPSRLNTSQLVETQLGKIAMKTGKGYELPDFMEESVVDYTLNELAKHGMSPTEDIYDPATGKTIPGIETGAMFFYKLKHMSELKERGRAAGGGYSAEEVPMKGEGAARRFGQMEASAVFSGGGAEVLRDAKILRGQRNDEFWKDFRDGKYPDTPGIPLVHKKFFAHLQAAGINLEDRSDSIHIFGATDKNLKDLTGNRQVKVAATFDSKNMQPIDGGLFDPTIFGADGDQWGYVELPEPVLNPMMFKSIGAILGWKDKELTEYLEGSRSLKQEFGTESLSKVLDNIDLNKELKAAKDTLKGTKATLDQKDLARKRIRAIEPMLREGKKPSDFLWTRMPILPPRFRAVTAMSNGTNIAADANFLYKRMIDACQDMEEAKKTLPEEFQLDARKSLYNAIGAVTGLMPTDDPKLESKGVGGVLKWAFGKGSPKLSSLHRKVFGANLDLGGLGTITPDNSLSIDQVGIPEKSAWKMFEPFVVRKLTQSGYSMTEALRQVMDHEPEAKQRLLEVMKERPILINRAPTLWRYGIQGQYPVLVKDNSIHVNPNICKNMNADFDGDSVRNAISIGGDLKNLENIFKQPLYNSENDVYYIPEPGNYPKTMKENGMLKNGSAEVVGFVTTPIEGIPVVKDSERKIKDNVTEWDVDGEYYVNAINKETGKLERALVTKISKHENLKLYDVCLETRNAFKHVITCTADKTMITYDDYGKLVVTDTKDAINRLVPRLHAADELATTDTIMTRYIELGDKKYPLSYDMGVFLGMMIGDGWVDVQNQARLAAECPQVKDEMLRLVKELELPHSGAGEALYRGYATERFGADVAHRVDLHLRKDLAVALREAIGSGAYNKRIPIQCFGASRAHIIGLLVGLIATDGNVEYAKPAVGKKAATKGIFFHTTSTDLRDGITAICRRLGIRCSVTTYRGKNSKVDCYMVAMSVMDTAKVYHKESKFRMIADSDKEALEKIVTDVDKVEINDYDIVPYPKHLRTAMAVAGFGCRDENGTTIVFAKTEMPRYAAKGSVNRATALKMVAQFRKTDWSKYTESVFVKAAVHYTPEEAAVAVEDWCKLVEDTSIDWEVVKSVTEREGLETAWDITVPGPLTFTTSDGTFVQDSMTTHVPVSVEAVNAIKKNMMPSGNLLSPKNYKAHFIPRSEFAQGLYLASRMNDKEAPVHFKTEEEMMQAYKKGQIKIDTPVTIG